MSTPTGWVAARPGEKYEKKCTMCWNGLCQKHPRQDHGLSLQMIDPEDKKRILAKVFEDKIANALQKKLSEKQRDEFDEAGLLRVGFVHDVAVIAVSVIR